tara:strand:+ start:162 stop:1178 length:1017 start_codon:yes stop_codon:yes gene_type:complete
MLYNWLCDIYLVELIDSFIDTQKRVSVFYISISIFLALGWSVWVSGGSLTKGCLSGFKRLFGASVLFSKSARADYKLLLINHALMLLVAPLLLTKMASATFIYFLLVEYLPSDSGVLSSVPYWSVMLGYTLFLFLLDDLSRFVVHLALHRIPLLWAFHKIHHSAETLTPLTVYRTHPLEGIIFSLRGILVQAASVAFFVFLFDDKVDLVSIYGVNLLLFIFNVTGANLRHSHIQISYGRIVEKFLISPAQHQIHHSVLPKHHNKNYGVVLAVWDRIFSTLCLTEKDLNLLFGLSEKQKPSQHNILKLYFGPFVEVWKFHSLFLSQKKLKKNDNVVQAT